MRLEPAVPNEALAGSSLAEPFPTPSSGPLHSGIPDPARLILSEACSHPALTTPKKPLALDGPPCGRPDSS
jgi:hypothetical protein